jgi:hypothetical protein
LWVALFSLQFIDGGFARNWGDNCAQLGGVKGMTLGKSHTVCEGNCGQLFLCLRAIIGGIHSVRTVPWNPQKPVRGTSRME